ncbi:MAG: LPP20 family lipoprotein [Sulfurimonas sp.]|uniref:LPP20 family lipoprotein n=1 Tax=Sulfurimonas sp. TaxID=2022749 RepID=UPI00262C2FE6|nr:LPP20 family lipoprotein [Sulfurimonas sp.]MDD2651597.1 LPP20 family lipoprotein [Sulfurimonas sp.]MDD3451408.1 LPP20 family lipoprotein [Sulfurimonas sp.]
MRKSCLFIAVAATLFFAGCSTKEDVPLMPKKALPAWYTNPPQSTQKTLYALGEGESKEVAVANALSMMASTLSVSIQSTFSSKKVVEEGVRNSHQQTTVSNIQSDVKKIRISHYEVVEAQELGFKKHVVLIASEKKKLFESLRSELEQKFAIADAAVGSLHLHHELEGLSIYKKVLHDLGDVPNMLVVMNVLQSSFNGERFIQKIQKIKNNYAALLASISFELEADEDSLALQAPVRDALSAKKVQIDSKSAKVHFKIAIRSDVQRASSYGFILARSAIEISVRDAKGTTIGGNKLHITGQSTQGYEIAKQSIAVKFGAMVQKEGIGKVLGLEL